MSDWLELECIRRHPDGETEAYTCEVAIADAVAWRTTVIFAPMRGATPEQWGLGDLEAWLDELGLSESEHQLAVLSIQKRIRGAIQIALAFDE